MAGPFSGAVVRTSHMSGIVTDLGTFLGQWLRGAAADFRRVRLHAALFAGFFGGGIAYVVYRHRRDIVVTLGARSRVATGFSKMLTCRAALPPTPIHCLPNPMR
jgi:hypothetical protein